MSATTEPTGGGPREPAGAARSSEAVEGAATLIGTSSSSYRCAVCSAELAVDQHYCVECGARRGSPRFKLASPRASETGLVAAAPAGVSYRATNLPPRVMALLAAAVVLLALGVGVLIGESGNSVKVSTVTVAAGASGGSGSSSTGGAGKSSSSGSSGASASKPSSG